jgi:imidazolonepropionase-like amidohydrolase
MLSLAVEVNGGQAGALLRPVDAGHSLRIPKGREEGSGSWTYPARFAPGHAPRPAGEENSMKRLLCGASWVTVLLAAVSAFAAPPTLTADELAKAPADAKRYTLLSKAGRHGHAEIWLLPDGTVMERDSMLLRGRSTEIEAATRLGADGMVKALDVRGFTVGGDAAETFRIEGRTATWKSQVDAGSAPYASPAFYAAEGGPFSSSVLVEALLAAPGHSVALLPGGRATMARLGEATVGEGERRLHLVCWGIAGLGLSPAPVWTTEDQHYWGEVSGISLLPAGYEDALDALAQAQDDALAASSRATAHALSKTPTAPIAFTHVRAFVGGVHFSDDQTIVVDHGTITAVGPSLATSVPAHAQVIDGQGRTLVPGLWDSHMHVAGDASGPLLLALGITSARDPGNDDELTLARARRRAAGDLLMPRVYPSSMIDGRAPETAQVANVAASLDEALAYVRRAKDNGFTGIKIYGSFAPAWVAPTAAEAHRLNLHVHGHVPAGMRPSEAIEAGYDEITHINFVMMEAMPDDVVAKSNGMARFTGTGRHARAVDLEADPIRSLIALMRSRHVSTDPTLAIFEGSFVPENGDLSPAYAPFTGTLPPATERGFREGGLAVPADLTRADFRASFAKLLALTGALHRAGVRVVAGTDGSGLELVRELELYVQAGFTNEEALAAATLEAARNVGVAERSGSIGVGKAADLVLVEGDPSHDIGALRNTRLVMMDGRLMDADALRAAAGISGRPHPVH